MCYGELQKRGVDVLAVSIDSVNAHKVWVEVELLKMSPCGVPFPLLEDRNAEITRAYGLWDEKEGMTARACFLVDPDGVVNAGAVLLPQIGPGLREFIRVIDACQYHRATGDDMPTNWEPGKPTIKPSIQLSGHVWQIWRPDPNCK